MKVDLDGNMFAVQIPGGKLVKMSSAGSILWKVDMSFTSFSSSIVVVDKFLFVTNIIGRRVWDPDIWFTISRCI